MWGCRRRDRTFPLREECRANRGCPAPLSVPGMGWTARRAGVQARPVLRGDGDQDEVTGEGTRFFFAQPVVDNVVQHKRSIVEQEVVFWRAQAEG